MELIKLIDLKEFQKQISDEMNELMQNLEEGILVSKDNTIHFTNQIFNNILHDINVTAEIGKMDETTLDFKIFKLFENEEK